MQRFSVLQFEAIVLHRRRHQKNYATHHDRQRVLITFSACKLLLQKETRKCL